jgi:hypothetical protein
MYAIRMITYDTRMVKYEKEIIKYSVMMCKYTNRTCSYHYQAINNCLYHDMVTYIRQIHLISQCKTIHFQREMILIKLYCIESHGWCQIIRGPEYRITFLMASRMDGL